MRTEPCEPASNRLHMRRLAAFSVALLLGLPAARSEAGDVTLARRLRVLPVPSEILLVCHRAQAKGSFRVMCPARLPRASVGYPSQPPNPLTARVLSDRGTLVGIEMGYGAPYPRGQRRNHPGRFLHLAILRGDVEVAAAPKGSTPLGTKRVGGRRGRLFQAPPYSNSRWGLYHGNHLIFRWRERGFPYTLSLHSWRRDEALQLLKKVINGLRPANALPSPRQPAPAPGLLRINFGEDLSTFAVNRDMLWVAEYYAGVHRVDPERGEIIGTPIRVQRFPNDIAASEESVWVVGAKKSVDRIDVAGRNDRTSVPVDASASAVAVGERYVWVASYDGGTLTRIDPLTNQVAGRPIRVGGRPNGVALSHGALWVTDFAGGRVLRVDESTGETVAEIPAGSGLSGIATTAEAIWVTDWDRDELLRIDPFENRVVARIGVGPAPAGVAAQDSSVWVTDYWDGTVRRIDAETNEVTTRIWGLEHPSQIGTSPGRLVVLDVGSRSILVIPVRESSGPTGDESRPGWLLIAILGGGFGAFAAVLVAGWRKKRRPRPIERATHHPL
jgi:streptogramin lyase